MTWEYNWYCLERLAEQRREEALEQAARSRLLSAARRHSEHASLVARLRNLLAAYRARAATSRAQ
jgi:hypothetical protein